MNSQLYRGQPALSYMDGKVYVNTDYIQPAAPALTTAQPVYNNMAPVPVAEASYAPPHPPPLKHEEHGAGAGQQSMAVVVPDGAGPGSVMTVAAPNGTIIQVWSLIYKILMSPRR